MHPTLRIRCTRASAACHAFTLVELLVVIGIIGALIAILLPVLAGVHARGRDIKCQSNLRQIIQGLLTYAAENKGSLPYGIYWERSDPTTWEPADGDFDGPYISWVSQISKYMGTKTNGVSDGRNIPPSIAPVFGCPEALQAFPHICSYSMNWIVGITPYYELVVSDFPPGGSAQIKPPQVTQMLKGGTALVWDTAVQPRWEKNDGYLLGADIDGQRFWSGAAVPQFRYFIDYDPFAVFPPAKFSNNKPVDLNTGGHRFYNIDPAQSFLVHYPYQGNLRFRHQKESTCNVGFSDGHVDSFHAKLKKDKSVYEHDALRRLFMIKWPSGISPKDGYPY